MGKKIFEQYLSEEELQNLKSSDYRYLSNEESRLVGLTGINICLLFIWFSILLATIFWFNKITLFFLIIASAPIISSVWVQYRWLKKWKEKIKSLKKE